mmetsp:Transcript_25475/g.60146  ORF Transcript_25475/g.60146 Transcript_25475/m.60146 type:complete len:221 (-) Transcript_25475:137-799(-)
MVGARQEVNFRRLLHCCEEAAAAASDGEPLDERKHAAYLAKLREELQQLKKNPSCSLSPEFIAEQERALGKLHKLQEKRQETDNPRESLFSLEREVAAASSAPLSPTPMSPSSTAAVPIRRVTKLSATRRAGHAYNEDGDPDEALARDREIQAAATEELAKMASHLKHNFSVMKDLVQKDNVRLESMSKTGATEHSRLTKVSDRACISLRQLNHNRSSRT